MNLESLMKGVQVAAVICTQWGDSGKGKIAELLAAEWADITARGTGGNNAGHTVVVNGKETIFHLIPTGILHDASGKRTILGNGMVINLAVLQGELAALDAEGLPYNHLMISEDAHVVLPFHVLSDESNVSQAQGGIGTTGRGIGPCYADKIARRGIKIGDLNDKDTLVKKIRKLAPHYSSIQVDEEKWVHELTEAGAQIHHFVGDTIAEMHRALRGGKKIAIEGAQGTLLSIECGTYPFVTSSDCSVNGTAMGVGLSARSIDLVLGVTKFPFMTRVGGGPFPTELGGTASEEYCSDDQHRLAYELAMFQVPHIIGDGKIRYNHQDPKIVELMNDPYQLRQGIGIRLAAGEYGATTGRPRRIGWTDAVAARYAVTLNKCVFVVTKADAIAGKDDFSICFGYNTNNGVTEDFSRSERVLRGVKPILEIYKGYGNITGVQEYESLPQSLQNAVHDFEEFTGAPVVMVSTGPERDHTIIRKSS